MNGPPPAKRGFDAGQFKVLLREGLRLSFFSGENGESGESGGGRNLLGAAYCLSLSTIAAAIVFESGDPGRFLLFTTSLSMIFTATSVIGELADGIFRPLDLAVTGHLPVSPFTRFAARFSELGVVLLILTLNLNLTPAILLCFMTGGNAAAPLICLAAGLAGAFFTAGGCLLLYAVAQRTLGSSRLRDALLHLNVIVTLAILGLFVNLGSLMGSEAFDAVVGKGWSPWYPPSWFSSLALLVLGLPGGQTGAALAAVAALAATLAPLALAALGTESLVKETARQRGGRSAPGPLMRLFETLFVRPGERAAFEFTAVNLGRDRGFRLKAYPLIGLPLLMMFTSLYEKRDPLYFIFMLQLMIIYLPLVITFVPYTDHHRAAWIFTALPVDEPRSFACGAEKAFIFRVVLPSFLIAAASLSLIWSPAAAWLNTAFSFCVALFFVWVRFRLLRAYPFSLEFRSVVAQNLMAGLFTALLLLAVVALIQYFTHSNIPLMLAQIALLALLVKGLFLLSGRRAPVKGNPS